MDRPDAAADRAAQTFAPRSQCVRAVTDDDGEAVTTLWNHVFAHGGSTRRRTVADWEWLYARNPWGRQAYLCEQDDGRVVAHYAGIPLRFQCFGQRAIAALVLDSMAHAEGRTGLAVAGPFVRTARAWVEHYSPPEVNAFHYGFPNTRAFAVGRRFLAYAPMFDRVPTLFRSFYEEQDDGTLGGGRPSSLVVEEVDRFGPWSSALNALWQRLAPLYPVAMVRDAAWLVWRFDQCPWPAYRRFLVRAENGELRGWFATRNEWQGQPILAVADLLVAPDDADALLAVLRGAVQAAREGPHVRVELWLPEQHPTFRHALTAGFRTELSLSTMVYVPRAAALPMGRMREHVYYTIADSDHW